MWKHSPTMEESATGKRQHDTSILESMEPAELASQDSVTKVQMALGHDLPDGTAMPENMEDIMEEAQILPLDSSGQDFANAGMKEEPVPYDCKQDRRKSTQRRTAGRSPSFKSRFCMLL